MLQEIFLSSFYVESAECTAITAAPQAENHVENWHENEEHADSWSFANRSKLV